MMDIDQNSFQTAFKAASENTRALMRDSRIYDCLLITLTKLQINNDTNLLILPFGYYLLGLISLETLHDELASLGIRNPKEFSTEMLSCIKSTQVAPTKESITESDSFQQDVSIHSPTANTEISPIRTMPQSPTAPAETVYTSTQAAILHESTTSPTPETTESRWDSAR